MAGESSWVGIHECGGLVSAIPNSSQEELFECAIEECESESPLDDSEYYVFLDKNLPNSLSATDIENLSRRDRRNIAECETKEEAIELSVECKEEDRLSRF